jgi:hypothetical protein
VNTAAPALQTYTLGQDASGQTLQLNTSRFQIQVARGLFDGELVVGVGLLAVSLDLDSGEGAKSNLANMFGVNAEAGAVWTPLALPLRAALTLRAPSRVGSIPTARPPPTTRAT